MSFRPDPDHLPLLVTECINRLHKDLGVPEERIIRNGALIPGSDKKVEISPKSPQYGDCYQLRDRRVVIVVEVSRSTLIVILYGEFIEISQAKFLFWLTSLFAVPVFRILRED